jgi:hypothetical protein
MRVISVDLASVRYTDIGVALLDGATRGVECLVPPLSGRPAPEILADWLIELVARHGAAGLCIDGPLGWKSPDTDSPHCRRSERLLRAPGKTGLPPDGVKPATYLAFTTFSIALFERLTMGQGFRLPGDPRDTSAAVPFVTESFPTAAWRALGAPPLPAKGRTTATQLSEWTARLRDITGFALDGTPTHDQLQAAVGGVAALAWASGDHHRVQLAGDPPFRLDGSWREGYIMVPATPSSPA